MSITVVTVRGELGAPTAREVYAAGHRYTIGNGNLEIISAEPRLLALYPSGNWLSAYVDDCVTVISPVQLDSAGAGSFGSSDDDALASDTGTGIGLGTESADLSPAADAGTDWVTDLAEADADTDLAETAVDAEDEIDLAEPDVDRSALPETNAPGDEVSSSDPAESPEPAALPSGMMRVAFRSITAKGPRGAQPDAPDRSRLRPVAFAPRILRAVRDEDHAPAESRSTRLRPVVFAPRTYRAARTQPQPAAPDDVRPDGGGADGDPETSAQ